MRIESIEDVLQWTNEYHSRLAKCLGHCRDASTIERGRMLLDYLAVHERKLAETVEGFRTQSDKGALHTLCYDYLQRYPVKPHPDCDMPFAEMTPEQVMQQIEHEHGQIIDLYKHLRSRVDAISAVELIDELISLEEHQAMQMSHTANRFHDL